MYIYTHYVYDFPSYKPPLIIGFPAMFDYRRVAQMSKNTLQTRCIIVNEIQ